MCKNCRWYTYLGDGEGICELSNISALDNETCSQFKEKYKVDKKDEEAK